METGSEAMGIIKGLKRTFLYIILGMFMVP